MDKKLAKITSASLEIKERGVLNFWIFVDYEDGGSQGIGGIVLDDYDTVLKERVGTSYGCEMIRQLLLTLGVNDLTEAKGKHIFVLGKGGGFNFIPSGIQMLRSDGSNRLVFEDVRKRFIEEIGDNL